MVDNEDEKDLYHKINTLKLEIYKWAELEKRQISIVKTTVHTVWTASKRQQTISSQVNVLHHVVEKAAEIQVFPEIYTTWYYNYSSWKVDNKYFGT